MTVGGGLLKIRAMPTRGGLSRADRQDRRLCKGVDWVAIGPVPSKVANQHDTKNNKQYTLVHGDAYSKTTVTTDANPNQRAAERNRDPDPAVQTTGRDPTEHGTDIASESQARAIAQQKSS